MNSGTIALLSAVAGIVVGTIGNVLISLITKRYEYRREMKKLIFEAGAREWKEGFEFVKQRSEGGGIAPPFVFILFNSMIMDLV